jgi:hypothetical protein
MPEQETYTVEGETFTVVHGYGGPEAIIFALLLEERLGYLAPSDEWVDMQEPLPDELQDAAHALQQAGMLPEFDRCFQ